MDGGRPPSLQPPVVHDRLLSPADVEQQVVVLTPRCHGSHLCSVGRLVPICDAADDDDDDDDDDGGGGGVGSKLDDSVGAVCGRAVVGVQRARTAGGRAHVPGGHRCRVSVWRRWPLLMW